MQQFTSIRVSKETRNMLAQCGKKTETFDDLLVRMIQEKKEAC